MAATPLHLMQTRGCLRPRGGGSLLCVPQCPLLCGGKLAGTPHLGRLPASGLALLGAALVDNPKSTSGLGQKGESRTRKARAQGLASLALF